MDKSKRNSLAGSKKGTSASARRYQNDPKARAKKKEYDKKYHATTERKKYRAELNKANRESHKKGTTKVGDNRDKSHTKSGKLVNESQSKNRARNKSNGKSTKK